LTKNGLGYILGYFFTNSSSHPDETDDTGGGMAPYSFCWARRGLGLWNYYIAMLLLTNST
jgi:hypothetical protein